MQPLPSKVSYKQPNQKQTKRLQQEKAVCNKALKLNSKAVNITNGQSKKIDSFNLSYALFWHGFIWQCYASKQIGHQILPGVYCRWNTCATGFFGTVAVCKDESFKIVSGP